MSKKRRETLRLEDDEIAVVGPIERWQHLAEVYEALSDNAPDHEKPYWDELAVWVREYLARNEADYDYAD